MIWDVIIFACSVWGVWHFGRATYTSVRRRYVVWAYSWASGGSKVYEADDPKRYRVGTWANVIGLGLMIICACWLGYELLTR